MSRYSEVETHLKAYQESRQTPRWQERGSVDDALRQCTGGTASLPATQEPSCWEAFFTHALLHRSLHPTSCNILSRLHSVGHSLQIGLRATQECVIHGVRGCREARPFMRALLMRTRRRKEKGNANSQVTAETAEE
jgi:hypothetical protein